MQVKEFYGEEYFARQSSGGELQGQANLFKFAPYIGPSDRVLDFGCGSGALLRALGRRHGSLVGVEINPVAVRLARQSGIDIFTDLEEVVEGSIDTVVSNHAIEHVEQPLEVMRGLYRVLRPGGQLVAVVPCDRPSYSYRADDPDFHLYSWSANNFGNLARAAGFEVSEAEEIVHHWPPKWQLVLRISGWAGFHLASRIWGRIRRARSQVRVVARKPM